MTNFSTASFAADSTTSVMKTGAEAQDAPYSEIASAMDFGFNCAQISRDLDLVRDPFYNWPELRVTITVFYALVSTCGALGNLLVVAAVIRNPQMRIPRNFFIINLALSDLSMCVLTVPFTMKFLLDNFWTLGSVMCKVVSSSQAVNVFVSTMSITAVGLDRYLVILFPQQSKSQRCALIGCFIAVWSLSIALALPLYFSADVVPVDPLAHLNMNISITDLCGFEPMEICAEPTESMFGLYFKRIYAVCCFVFQYSLPLLTLTFVYSRIIYRLKQRAEKQANRTADVGRIQYVVERQNRLNRLLVCIVVIFAVSWLPLNIYMTWAAFEPEIYKIELFAMCHMMGMTSACANPILYGVFNENFRAEFSKILESLGIIFLCRKSGFKKLLDRKHSPRPMQNGAADSSRANKSGPRSSTDNVDGRQCAIELHSLLDNAAAHAKD